MRMEAVEAKFACKGKPYGRDEFDKLLGHCTAVTDAPCNAFAPELIEAYPEAKVVLVVRDIESWMRSLSPVVTATFRFDVVILAKLDPARMGRMIGLARRWIQVYFGAMGEEDLGSKLREGYRRHYAEIRRITPKDRLLEYELGSGCEPLCKFLGKNVPGVPFPRVDEVAALQNDTTIRRRLVVVALELSIVICAIVAVGLGIYWKIGNQQSLTNVLAYLHVSITQLSYENGKIRHVVDENDSNRL